MTIAPDAGPGGADPFDLARFVAAQAPVFDRALAELRAGHKRGHWMWFVFPQLRGLGRSPTAVEFGIGSLAEARAYLAHPVLGPRLVTCARALLALPRADPELVLGSIDAVKLRSSMTLFSVADPGQVVFTEVLERWFDGEPDPLTLQLLAR